MSLTTTAAKQLGKLDRNDAKRITGFLRDRLAGQEDPRALGKALTGPPLGTYWRYRVGDFRLICSIEDGALCVLVMPSGDRAGQPARGLPLMVTP